MRKVPMLLAAAAAMLVAPLLDAARSAPVQSAPAVVVAAPTTPRLATYKVYSPTGTLLRNASYRVTTAGGNCCEVQANVMASGRILELGGGYPFYSDDRGATWKRVSPQIGNNGEGAIVSAHNGDILGVTWGIDRLTSYKYTAAANTWHSSEVVLHTPFYDRPWITIARGPFNQPGGGTVPYVTILHGGWPSKAVEFISYDGLTYVQASDPFVDVRAMPSTSGALPVTSDPSVDYMQPQYAAETAPLPNFGAVRFGLCASGIATLTTSANWACRTLPGGIVGPAHADSRGWLHEMQRVGKTLVYRVSTNGGASWRSVTSPLPGGSASSFTVTDMDFKSHGGVQKTAVAVRANVGGSGQQDLVFVYSYTGGVPVLAEVHYIGLGDFVVGRGLGAGGPRLDFTTVAILPDGKIVSSIFDSATGEPALAIEL